MEEQDIVYSKLIEKAIEKGWIPNKNLKESMSWTFSGGTFFMKNPQWDGEKIIEQMGACSIEKVIFDHSFAEVLYGEEYTMTLTNLAILPSEERAEYLKLMYLID